MLQAKVTDFTRTVGRTELTHQHLCRTDFKITVRSKLLQAGLVDHIYSLLENNEYINTDEPYSVNIIQLSELNSKIHLIFYTNILEDKEIHRLKQDLILQILSFN